LPVVGKLLPLKLKTNFSINLANSAQQVAPCISFKLTLSPRGMVGGAHRPTSSEITVVMTIFKTNRVEVKRNFNQVPSKYRSRGSSVSKVSGYGLGDQAIQIRSPA
jgi:hypothetical protein